MGTKRHTIDMTTMVDIVAHLEGCIKMLSGERRKPGAICTYDGGVSDDVVAKHFNASPATVRNLRKKFFGDLRIIRSSAEGNFRASGSVYKRVTHLDYRLTDIEDYLTRTDPNWKGKLL